MSSINGVGNAGMQHQEPAGQAREASGSGKSFGEMMSRVADGALSTVARVAPLIPGGQLIGMAAQGLQELRGSAPSGLMGSGQDQQINEMFDMQKQSQAFNLQYMQLQTELQNDNRRFSTLSNLMKVRHDTAKAAINNMHA